MTKNKIVHNIKLSPKDKIKKLMLPNRLSKELAYIIGVLAGDGNIYVRNHKNDYRIKCVGNPKDEKKYYKKVLKPLFKKVFNLNIDLKDQDSNTTYGFYIYSKALTKYLSEIFKLPIGKKINKLNIPRIIIQNGFFNYFLKGLVDTDFCLTYKKNGTYPCIIGSSNSKEFFKSISLKLKSMGFTFYEAYDYKLMDNRFKKGFSLINRIELNGKKNLDLWIQKIGFWSPKHLKKIKG